MTHITTGTSEEIVNVRKATINGEEVSAVDARELHAFLGSSYQFADWIKERVNSYKFVQGIDFIVFQEILKNSMGRPRNDYLITLDMAKELSMVERTERGKQARRYFIECERRLNAPRDLATSESLRKLADKIDELSQLRTRIDEDYAEYVATCNVSGLAIAASVLRQGPFQFIEWLVRKNYITPSILGGARVSAQYEFAGYFEAKDFDTAQGWRRQLYVTRKGFEHFRDQLTADRMMPPTALPPPSIEADCAPMGALPARGNKGKTLAGRTRQR
jgi:phage anti-repressor protein